MEEINKVDQVHRIDDKVSFRASGAQGSFSQLSKKLDKWKLLILKYLEGIDTRLSNRQRKWLFCIVLMCWSSGLLYLLGTAIRRPPAAFVWPFAHDSSQVSLNKLKGNGDDRDKFREKVNVMRPSKKKTQDPVQDMTCDMGIDYSLLKINRNGAKQPD